MFGADIRYRDLLARDAVEILDDLTTRTWTSDGCVHRRTWRVDRHRARLGRCPRRYGPVMFDSISDSGVLVDQRGGDRRTRRCDRVRRRGDHGIAAEQVRWSASDFSAGHVVHRDRRRTGSVPGCARRCAAAEDLGRGDCVGLGRSSWRRSRRSTRQASPTRSSAGTRPPGPRRHRGVNARWRTAKTTPSMPRRVEVSIRSSCARSCPLRAVG